MRTRTHVIARAGFVVAWVALAAAVAFLVARHETSSSEAKTSTMPPVSLGQRQTATLATHTIMPVVSSDGAVVADRALFDLEARIAPRAMAYQLLQPPVGVKALIDGGPAGFECGWLGIQAGPQGMVMRCRIPANVTVVPGLSGTMVLAMSKPVDKMALPVTAVVGGAQQGQVVVIGANGASSVRQVGPGVSDSFWIEITSGLQPGETVLENPIQTDFALNAP